MAPSDAATFSESLTRQTQIGPGNYMPKASVSRLSASYGEAGHALVPFAGMNEPVAFEHLQGTADRERIMRAGQAGHAFEPRRKARAFHPIRLGDARSRGKRVVGVDRQRPFEVVDRLVPSRPTNDALAEQPAFADRAIGGFAGDEVERDGALGATLADLGGAGKRTVPRRRECHGITTLPRRQCQRTRRRRQRDVRGIARGPRSSASSWSKAQGGGGVRPDLVTAGFKNKTDGCLLARDERGRELGALAMSEVQHAIADPQRRSVGCYIAQPSSQLGMRVVGREGNGDFGIAEDLHGFGQHVGVEAKRHPVVYTLVGRHLAVVAGPHPSPAPMPMKSGERNERSTFWPGAGPAGRARGGRSWV